MPWHAAKIHLNCDLATIGLCSTSTLALIIKCKIFHGVELAASQLESVRASKLQSQTPGNMAVHLVAMTSLQRNTQLSTPQLSTPNVSVSLAVHKEGITFREIFLFLP